MLLLIFEVAFVVCGLVGVWFVFWPAALILAGVLGVVACERAGARPRASVTPIRRREAA